MMIVMAILETTCKMKLPPLSQDDDCDGDPSNHVQNEITARTAPEPASGFRTRIKNAPARQ